MKGGKTGGCGGGRDEEVEEQNQYLSLFETKQAKGHIFNRSFSTSIFIGICLLLVYRVAYLPAAAAAAASDGGGEGRWAWIGLFMAELWFSFYWILTQSHRWNRVFRYTFKHRLSQRFENNLPGVDIFVCTADPTIEPPLMVINTVLSVMAYDYPPEKLSVFLSDDGGSDLTFYSLLEASHFSKFWLPFCKKFKIEPRSPEAYFSTVTESDPHYSDDGWSTTKRLYDEMKNRIETATKLGRIPEEVRTEHKGFAEWNSVISPRDHQTILQILINGRDSKAMDKEGCRLPTLVYLSREKRHKHPHHFKAGAMNALIRVSSSISNGEIIMNVDCDMYSNNSESIRDALCFFMDGKKGHNIAFVQFPQKFKGIGRNDIYSASLSVIAEVEFPGLDGNGGPLYIGSGCFHRRETLCGKTYSEECKGEWKSSTCSMNDEQSVHELENKSKALASCTYEQDSQWGKEMGLKYGVPVEDVLTGLSIQCRGWKSVYFNPQRAGFMGVAPNTLVDTLVQHKRWSEGDFQIFLSKYNPFLYGHGKIPLALQMGYSVYCLWAVNSFAVLYYIVVPPLCLIKGTPLFPKISSLWSLPFMYLLIASYTYSLYESISSGVTLQGWWNEQRIWMFKRTSSYFFAAVDAILYQFGFSNISFVITSKVSDPDVTERYEKEIMEFGNSNQMFTIIATLALLNLFSLFGGLKKVTMDVKSEVVDQPLFLQVFLCSSVVLINIPVYQGLFFRKDKGRMPTSLTLKSVALALSICMSYVCLC